MLKGIVDDLPYFLGEISHRFFVEIDSFLVRVHSFSYPPLGLFSSLSEQFLLYFRSVDRGFLDTLGYPDPSHRSISYVGSSLIPKGWTEIYPHDITRSQVGGRQPMVLPLYLVLALASLASGGPWSAYRRPRSRSP